MHRKKSNHHVGHLSCGLEKEANESTGRSAKNYLPELPTEMRNGNHSWLVTWIVLRRTKEEAGEVHQFNERNKLLMFPRYIPHLPPRTTVYLDPPWIFITFCSECNYFGCIFFFLHFAEKQLVRLPRTKNAYHNKTKKKKMSVLLPPLMKCMT